MDSLPYIHVSYYRRGQTSQQAHPACPWILTDPGWLQQTVHEQCLMLFTNNSHTYCSKILGILLNLD